MRFGLPGDLGALHKGAQVVGAGIVAFPILQLPTRRHGEAVQAAGRSTRRQQTVLHRVLKTIQFGLPSVARFPRKRSSNCPINAPAAEV